MIFFYLIESKLHNIGAMAEVASPCGSNLSEDILRDDIIRLISIIFHEKMMKSYGPYILFPEAGLEIFNNGLRIEIIALGNIRVEIFVNYQNSAIDSKNSENVLVSFQLPGMAIQIIWHPGRKFPVSIVNLQWVRDTLEKILEQSDIIIGAPKPLKLQTYIVAPS